MGVVTTPEPVPVTVSVTPLHLTLPKLEWLWEKLQGRPSEFSDFTAPDPVAFKTAFLTPDLSWFEIGGTEVDTRALLALRYRAFEPDADVLLIMLDRKPAEKVQAMRTWQADIFNGYPVQRLSVQVPAIHFALKRLLEHAGWRYEGKKRDAMHLGGRWVDVCLYGLIRNQAD